MLKAHVSLEAACQNFLRAESISCSFPGLPLSPFPFQAAPLRPRDWGHLVFVNTSFIILTSKRLCFLRKITEAEILKTLSMMDLPCSHCLRPDPQGRESVWQFRGCRRWLLHVCTSHSKPQGAAATGAAAPSGCALRTVQGRTGGWQGGGVLTQVAFRRWPAPYPCSEVFQNSSWQMHTKYIILSH